MQPQPVRLWPVDPGHGHHPISHPDFNLVEQPGRWRIKRVIKVKDPRRHMSECFGNHKRMIPWIWRRENTTMQRSDGDFSVLCLILLCYDA